MSKIIVGTGEYKYKVIAPFGKTFEDSKKIGAVSHVSADSKDNIYFIQRIDPQILIFNRMGDLVNHWSKRQLIDCHGVYITKNDDIFLATRGVHQVLKYDIDGQLVLSIGNRENPSWQKPFNHPTDIAISKANEIYVSDGYGNACIHKFSPEGELLFSWGKPGSGPGEFHTPHGIWVDDQDRVYVVDRDNNRIQIFNSEGKYITEWRDFFHPMDIFADSDSVFYITDQTPRFSVVNVEGELLARGFAPDAGHGLWGDSQGNLYLAGHNRGVVKLLKQ